MKNFLLLTAPKSRKEEFLLIHLESDNQLATSQREFEPFSEYMRWLDDRGYAYNTIKTYGEHVARFIDYLWEAPRTKTIRSNQYSLAEVVQSYQSYLLYGCESEIPLASELATRLSRTHKAKVRSIGENIESSIGWFIELMKDRDYLDGKDRLFTNIIAELPSFRDVQKQKIINNSWLAGTIKGALSQLTNKKASKKPKVFSGIARRVKNSEPKFKSKAFPLEYAYALLEGEKDRRQKNFYRDKAFYALLLSTGCRASEAMQIRLSDIKKSTNGLQVELVNPFNRSNPELTEDEAKMLVWKGRATEHTFLIEPFASKFFELLDKYIEYERDNRVSHDYVFQCHDGRPFFCSDRSNRNKTFKRNVQALGLNPEGLSIHSLRHFYGTYTLNYLPVPDSHLPGLKIDYVQILMGHSSISSTEKYAVRDTELLDAYLEHANTIVMSNQKSFMSTVKAKYYAAQLKMIDEDVARTVGHELHVSDESDH